MNTCGMDFACRHVRFLDGKRVEVERNTEMQNVMFDNPDEPERDEEETYYDWDDPDWREDWDDVEVSDVINSVD